MAGQTPENLQKHLAERLAFYEDLGIHLFYRDRRAAEVSETQQPMAAGSVTGPNILAREELNLSKTLSRPGFQKVAPTAPPKNVALPLPMAEGPSLFDAAEKIVNDTLLRIREDLGQCTRCKLHRFRHSIVFGDGNPKAELVFVGEGPGADEDAQGLPFVGRAGKLLTQMIEAMGLQRKDVYICNVVKCRPPENRLPEDEEISTCSPFLLRQLEVIAPKVIVCLGAVAAKTLLKTNRSISSFRGQWLDHRASKLMVTYHPAYLLRNPSAKGEVWKDLQKVMAVLGLQARKGKPA
jgi:uracil-DNA glycosylase